MKRFQTSRRLWLIASAVAYVALGFVDFEDAAYNADHTLWGAIWGMLTTQRPIPEEMPTALLGFAVMLTIPAAMVGWLIQAVAVMIGPRALPWAVRSQSFGLKTNLHPEGVTAHSPGQRPGKPENGKP